MEYIKLEDCKEGYLYYIDGRNASLGIFWNNEFTIIRNKFGMRFLDKETHWDYDNIYGTAIPLKEIEKCPFRQNEGKEIFEYLDQKLLEKNSYNMTI